MSFLPTIGMLQKEIEYQPSTPEVIILHVAELCSWMKGNISKTQQPFIGKVQKGTRSMLSSSTIMQKWYQCTGFDTMVPI